MSDTNYVYRVRAYHIYGSSAWTSDLDGTTWKPYLSRITATNDVITNAGNYTFRVERTASSPYPLIVNVTTTVSNATVPTTVTIPANARSVGFTLATSTGATVTDQRFLNATSDGFAATLPVLVRPSTATLAPGNVNAQAGAGGVWLKWTNPENAVGLTYPGVRVARRAPGGQFQYLTPTLSDVELHVDLTASAGVTYDYQVHLINSGGGVAGTSATVTATPTTGSAQLSTSNLPTTASGSFDVTVAGSTQSGVYLLVDGVYHSGGDNIQDRIPGGPPTARVDVTRLPAGPHTLQIVNELSSGSFSPTYTFTVQDVPVVTRSEGIVVPELGLVPKIGRTLPPTNLQWTITLRNLSNVTVRQWSGYGADAFISWDGKDDAGQNVSRGRYVAQLTGDGIDYGFCDTLRADASPDFLALVMLDKSGGIAYDINRALADRIVSNLALRYPATAQNPDPYRAAVVIYTEDKMLAPFFKKYIKYALRTARYFYADGHGSVNNVFIGSNLRLTADNDDSSDTRFSIGDIVSDRGFGFKLLFPDSCSASGFEPTGPLSGMTFTPNLNFAYWGAVGGQGGYIGSNGLIAKSITVIGPLAIKNRWGRWREIFFDRFVRDGFSMQDAMYSAHLGCDPPFDTAYAPYDTVIHNGQVFPKLVFFGDVYMP